MEQIFLKRIYEPYNEFDDCRILIDRLWPRGMSKEAARLDYWLKEAAPSTELRKRFGHMPERFEEFRTEYLRELQTNSIHSQAVEQIIEFASTMNVTLLYGSKDPVYNHARVLQEEIIRKIHE